VLRKLKVSQLFNGRVLWGVAGVVEWVRVRCRLLSAWKHFKHPIDILISHILRLDAPPPTPLTHWVEMEGNGWKWGKWVREAEGHVYLKGVSFPDSCSDSSRY